jgi:hypothetical protein
VSRDGFRVVAQQDLSLAQEELTKEEGFYTMGNEDKYALSYIGRTLPWVRLKRQ